MDEVLVALLMRLSGYHGGDAGNWFLEAGFGASTVRGGLLFEDLDRAEAWFVGG